MWHWGGLFCLEGIPFPLSGWIGVFVWRVFGGEKLAMWGTGSLSCGTDTFTVFVIFYFACPVFSLRWSFKGCVADF